MGLHGTFIDWTGTGATLKIRMFRLGFFFSLQILRTKFDLVTRFRQCILRNEFDCFQVFLRFFPLSKESITNTKPLDFKTFQGNWNAERWTCVDMYPDIIFEKPSKNICEIVHSNEHNLYSCRSGGRHNCIGSIRMQTKFRQTTKKLKFDGMRQPMLKVTQMKRIYGVNSFRA